ncbi:MAG: HNH endonuclease domain-containing protein [Janthinobacterium lividum]
MPAVDHSIATILKHDNKTTSYKIALLRALNDLVLSYPGLAQHEQPVAVPLVRIAELWAAYYWPFMDEQQPIYQGARAQRDGIQRNDVSFRPALTQLRTEWHQLLLTTAEPADGFFLLTEMRTPRRRATYPPALLTAYTQALAALVTAIKMPIQYAGPEQWSIFPKPARLSQLPHHALPLPGTDSADMCVLLTASLWQAFHQLSLYIEALCIHEWSLFTETVAQAAGTPTSRGHIYTLLTARPNNRRPLTWERNQVDILLHEQVSFTCPWTQKLLTQPQHYDLDHLLPLALYPINELWNLLPVDREFNQRTKRDRVPSSQRLASAVPYFAAAYTTYTTSPALNQSIRADAALRFAGLKNSPSFPAELAHHAAGFIADVADARYAVRF